MKAAKEAKTKANDALKKVKADAKVVFDEANSKYKQKEKAGKTATANTQAAGKAVTAAQAATKKPNTEQAAAQKTYNTAERAYKMSDRYVIERVHRLEWGYSNPLCVVIPKGSDDMTECQNTGAPAMNVVPINKPSTALFPNEIPTLCANHENMKDKTFQDGDRVCYGLNEARPNDSGAAFDVSPDPEDPVFYSTCYKRQSSAEISFDGNTCGKPCELDPSVDAPVWR